MTEEPVIAVGLLQEAKSVAFRLVGPFADGSGERTPEGEYRVECHEGILRCSGPRSFESSELLFVPREKNVGRFALETIIGLNFHWQQTEAQTFSGGIKLIPSAGDRITVINEVALESYLTSVICSEMSAWSPGELIKAHSVVSRSWLLAQRKGGSSQKAANPEWIRWYDHEAHTSFDVCADDHCQRYHGIDRIHSPEAERAILETRGQVLCFAGKVCDTRYGKCCGGVTEDFRVAWSDEEVPYLIPVFDGPAKTTPCPSFSLESDLREFMRNPPDVYCNCTDDKVLDSILTVRDRQTADFFRWKVVLSARWAGERIKEKTGMDLGRIIRLEPIERGLSGRLKRLRFIGETGSLVIGKELEIRRVLSPTHLYSSAFTVDAEGPAGRPKAFVLNGAGWGHGVGLCQIGAAVMAWRKETYENILTHYYPGTSIERIYE